MRLICFRLAENNIRSFKKKRMHRKNFKKTNIIFRTAPQLSPKKITKNPLCTQILIYSICYSVLQLRLTNVLCEKCETDTPQ